jgi:hypothetical protein
MGFDIQVQKFFLNATDMKTEANMRTKILLLYCNFILLTKRIPCFKIIGLGIGTFANQIPMEYRLYSFTIKLLHAFLSLRANVIAR